MQKYGLNRHAVIKLALRRFLFPNEIDPTVDELARVMKAHEGSRLGVSYESHDLIASGES
jgi:hypothetical protein